MPRLNTITEWIKCLASPKYAENTSLRITEEDERRALRIADVIIAILIILCAYQTAICINRLYTNHKIYQINEYNKLHPIKSTEFHVI